MSYIADSLYFQGQNKTISIRFDDWIKEKPQDDRSADEIVTDLMNRMG